MFDSPVFEDQPLVPTDQNTGKFDIDAFLVQAKSQQKRWFISTSIFAAVAVAYSIYLLIFYPLRIITPVNVTGGLAPINACSPSWSPAYMLSALNVVILALPLVLWGDQLRSFLRPAPSNGPGVIVFKPYFVRSVSNDQITTPGQYFQYIRDRSINWLQTILLGIALASVTGFFLTMGYTQQDLCLKSSWNLALPYLVGTLAAVGMFLAVLTTIVYQHKQKMSSFSTSSPASLDSYHPL